MTYPTYPKPSEPLVSQNPFRSKPPQTNPIPTFAEAKPNLPEPILPHLPEWVGMYWRSWEIAWSHLRQPTAQNGFISTYLGDVCGEHLFMWDAAFTMQFGLYGRRAFNPLARSTISMPNSMMMASSVAKLAWKRDRIFSILSIPIPQAPIFWHGPSGAIFA